MKHPRTFAAFVAAALVVWLGATAALAESGFLADWTAQPPRWPLLPLTALGTFLLLGQTLIFRRLLAEVPPWQPVALQTFRVGGATQQIIIRQLAERPDCYYVT